MVQLKSHQLVTSQTNSHLYNTCWFVHTPTTIPSVVHEIKVLMRSHYQQMPSWACHRWLARSQRRELTASPFKGSSPAAASPKIPLLSNSLCYIYYLHLDKILSNHPFFSFRSNCSDHQPLEWGVEKLTSPSRLPFLLILMDSEKQSSLLKHVNGLVGL